MLMSYDLVRNLLYDTTNQTQTKKLEHLNKRSITSAYVEEGSTAVKGFEPGPYEKKVGPVQTGVSRWYSVLTTTVVETSTLVVATTNHVAWTSTQR